MMIAIPADAMEVLRAENELAILFYSMDPNQTYITGDAFANVREGKPSKAPRARCPHCGSASTVYHWWWCNATPEYLAWMKNPHRGACEAFVGRKYKDED